MTPHQRHQSQKLYGRPRNNDNRPHSIPILGYIEEANGNSSDRSETNQHIKVICTAGTVLPTALHCNSPEHVQENHRCHCDFQADVPRLLRFVLRRGEDADEDEDQSEDYHEGVKGAGVGAVVETLESKAETSFFGRDEEGLSEGLRRTDWENGFFWIVLYFVSMSGLYASQPHTQRLRELHALSRQLLQASRHLSKQPYLLPHSSATLAKLDVLRTRSARPLLLSSSSETSAQEVQDTRPRRYTAPSPTAVSVIRRKDSPEYLLTISSAAYQQYASTTISGHTSALGRPKSESRHRTTPIVKATFRTPLTPNPPKSPHYMQPLESARPLRARKYLLKRKAQLADKPMGVFDLRDVFDASQGVFTRL